MKKFETPNDLERFVLTDHRVYKAYLLEYFEDKIPSMVVCIQLTFWRRLRCVLSGSFKNKIKKSFEERLELVTPEGFKIEIILEV